VLPFRNLTGAPDAAFYEFSLADGVITELAHLKSLVVRPSVYVAPYVGQAIDPRQIGEDLAAELVLTGAFIKAEGRIRVTVQLLNTASGEIVWSDKLDVADENLLTIQDEIAEHLIDGLKLRLTPEEQLQIDRPMTRSTDAYEYYLRARDLLYRYIQQTHDEADLEATIKMLHEAIGLDPEFARAHATLGRCYVMHAQGWGGAENYMLAERSLKRALELDPSIVNAHLQMVYVDLHHGDKQHARETIDRLLREAPDDPSVLFVAGMLYRLDGLYERALEMYDRALEVNPKDLVVVSFNRARGGARAPAAQDVPRGGPLQPGTGGRRPGLDRGRAPPEPSLRRSAAAPCLVPLGSRRARGGPRPHHRSGEGGGHRRPRHRLLAGLFLRHGGDEGRGHRVGASRDLAGQRELPSLRPEPQARLPAGRPALRRDDGGPEAPLREPP
jgi:serine/threonine-protein kinase